MSTDYKANLKTAAVVVSKNLGVDPTNLTYEQRTQYNTALANYILQYPLSFDPAVVTIAQNNLAQQPYQALQDTSFDWGAFAADVAPNLESKLTTFIIVGIITVGVVLFLPRGLAAVFQKAKPPA